MKKFRTAFAIEPSHNVSGLRRHAENIEFILTGYEELDELPNKIRQSLSSFDSNVDVIIPIGKVTFSLLVGMIIAEKFTNEHINIGIYKNKEYRFVRIPIHETVQT